MHSHFKRWEEKRTNRSGEMTRTVICVPACRSYSFIYLLSCSGANIWTFFDDDLKNIFGLWKFHSTILYSDDKLYVLCWEMFQSLVIELTTVLLICINLRKHYYDWEKSSLIERWKKNYHKKLAHESLTKIIRRVEVMKKVLKIKVTHIHDLYRKW